jgi:hypothetical protein
MMPRCPDNTYNLQIAGWEIVDNIQRQQTIVVDTFLM